MNAVLRAGTPCRSPWWFLYMEPIPDSTKTALALIVQASFLHPVHLLRKIEGGCACVDYEYQGAFVFHATNVTWET